MTTTQTRRARDIQAFLRECVEERRELLLRKYEGRTDANSRTKSREIKETYELESILHNGATQNVARAQMATHISKGTHPDTEVKNTTSLRIAPEQFAKHSEAGTHSLQPDGLPIDATGDGAINKRAYIAYWLLQQRFEEKSVLQLLESRDEDAINALHQDAKFAQERADVLVQLARQKCSRFASHTLMKQVYWLVGADVVDDTQYHLLAPLYATSLAHVVHAEISDARFGEANKEARRAYYENQKQPHDGVYREYRNLAIRKMGGSNSQNISHLNSERGGVNYLLDSLPPPAWETQNRPQKFFHIESVFVRFKRDEFVRGLLADLCSLLEKDPKPTKETRQRREAIEQALRATLFDLASAIQRHFPPGWTRDKACKLPLCEQRWLDPERAHLPPRAGHEEEDAAFTNASGWKNEVAVGFAIQINDTLHDHDLPVGQDEAEHWKQAISSAIMPYNASASILESAHG
ncbi:MAG: type I-F CRISPR-associated protein Csy1 [Zoogloeaceae bacterium]|jgi:CRISPR-associated protein Csy1|nr:type I-F CRISPR-associated protein Csy1 [Zoogloeaceae bacterium]